MYVYTGFPGGSDGKESACSVGDLGLIPGLGRFPWRRERLYPLQYSGLKNLFRLIVQQTCVAPLGHAAVGGRACILVREVDSGAHQIQYVRH